MATQVSQVITPGYVELFGRFRLLDSDGAEIGISNRRARLLLAILAITPDEVHDRDFLAKFLWSGRFLSQSRASLRQCLYGMRKLLEPRNIDPFEVTRSTVALNRDAVCTDLESICRHLDAGEYREASSLLGGVCALPLLDELNCEDEMREWLNSRRRTAEQRLDECLRAAIRQADMAGEQALARSMQRMHEQRAGKQPAGAQPERTVEPIESKTVIGDYSVAVLPFDCTGNDPQLVTVADDFARDLTEQLSLAPHLRVSAFDALAGSPVRHIDIATAAGLLDVRYLVTGSVSDIGGQRQMRIALVNSEATTHLWSKRIEIDRNSKAGTSRHLIAELSTSLLCEIQVSEAIVMQSADLQALREHEMLQSTEMMRKLYSGERAGEIVNHLSEIVRKNPDSAHGHAGLAIQLSQSAVCNWSQDRFRDVATARNHALRAQSLAPLEADTIAAQGIIAAMFGDSKTSVRHMTRACARDPNNPHYAAVLGWQSCFLLNDPAPIELILGAERMAPNHPRMAIWANYRATSLVSLERFDEAREAFLECAERNPNWFFNYIVWASLLAHLGEDDEARDVLGRGLALGPHYGRYDYAQKPFDFPLMWSPGYTCVQARESLARIWPEHPPTV